MRALLIDCETTGLLINRTVKPEHRPRLVEFHGSMIFFERTGDQVTPVLQRELDTLVRPLGTLDETSKAAEVTGITNEMVKNAPPVNEVMPRIKELVEASPLVIAHNASFDQEVIDVEADRLKLSIKWPRLLCSVEQTVHLKGYRLSLSELHELLTGERFSGAHRARVDVQALARCVAKMIERDML